MSVVPAISVLFQGRKYKTLPSELSGAKKPILLSVKKSFLIDR